MVDKDSGVTGSAKSEIRIVPYDVRYDDDFRRLNYEWLEEFFEVEPYDRIVLGNPQKHIIRQGGKLFFALLGDQVVGDLRLAQTHRPEV